MSLIGLALFVGMFCAVQTQWFSRRFVTARAEPRR
jgi:hypothetical protein